MPRRVADRTGVVRTAAPGRPPALLASARSGLVPDTSACGVGRLLPAAVLLAARRPQAHSWPSSADSASASVPE